MPDRRVMTFAALLLAALSAVLAVARPVVADERSVDPSEHRLAAARPVHGELIEIDGLRVLRLWGTSRQRGYAHGWLLAPEIHRLFEVYLAETRISGGPEKYEAVSLPLARTLMRVRTPYQREMHAIVEGMTDRLGNDGMIVPALGRPLEYGDILALNASSDWVRPFCSSFAVIGGPSVGRQTLTGRNLDWHRIEGLIGNQVVIVQTRDTKLRRAPWASVAWPGFIGCLTGMNSGGVTLAIHDVPSGRPERMFGLTPRGLALREAIEKATGPDAIDEIADLFRRRPIAVASNVFVSMPRASQFAYAAVIEYDGSLENDGGVTVRRGREVAVCTNHFRQRAEPVPCERYDALVSALKRCGTSESYPPLDVDGAWRLLAGVAQPRPNTPNLLTHHSVVVQPADLRMHVALAEPGRPAAEWRRSTLDLSPLFFGPTPLDAER